MKVGLFGGTFDPPHIGHLILAEEALAQLQLDQVLWVLTQYPPHKKEKAISSVEVRLEMLQAGISGNPSFVLSRIDIDRPPPHYAVDTLRLLAEAQPEAEWFYLMGEDSLHDLPTWYAPEDLVAACDHFGVMRRAEKPVDLLALEALLPGITSKVEWIHAPLIDISASEVRCRVSQGQPFRYFLPPEVYHIVQKYQLYRSEVCRTNRSNR